MNKTFYYTIFVADLGIYSEEFNKLEDCITACKADCAMYNIEFNDNNITIFSTIDSGKTSNIIKII